MRRIRRDVKSFKIKTKDGLIDVGKLFAKVRALSPSRGVCCAGSLIPAPPIAFQTL